MTQQFGKDGEQAVINYLLDQKFEILTNNYKKFFGEIDIIAKQKDLLVFVEVKARKNSIVSLHSLVSYSKQQKIIKVAKAFIAQHQINAHATTLRFDVALLHIQDSNTKPKITYIPNAFNVSGY